MPHSAVIVFPAVVSHVLFTKPPAAVRVSPGLVLNTLVPDTKRSISGTTTKASMLTPRVRVWLISRRYGTVVRATMSDASGHYHFKSLPANAEEYIVLGFDDTKTYDPEAKDFITATVDP